jgi:L-ascorbate metabolism protein UlaG (beta-lactamase superfamily)
LRICHFGDFGQRGLREEQAAAIGDVDLLFLPVGGGPTIDGAAATVIVEHLEPRWVVPMHDRTARTNFLETEEAFVERATHAERLEVSEFDPAAIAAAGGPVVVIPAAP